MSDSRRPSIAAAASDDFQTQLISVDMLLDAGLPTVVFLLAYSITGHDLGVALWAALGVAGVIAVLRVLRRESIQNAIAGFVGVAVAAWLAARSGEPEDFFLPALFINAFYIVAYLISIAIKWPLLGVLIGLATGEGMRWRSSPFLLRAYTLASWFWVAMFALRLLIQVPLFLSEEVVALGLARLAMGWPLFLLCLYASWLVVSRARRAEAAHEAALAQAEERPESTEPAEEPR
jgi:hypothetical protein